MKHSYSSFSIASLTSAVLSPKTILEQCLSANPFFFSCNSHSPVIPLGWNWRILTVSLFRRARDSWHVLFIDATNIYPTSTSRTVLSAGYTDTLENVLLPFLPTSPPRNLHSSGKGSIGNRELQYLLRRIIAVIKCCLKVLCSVHLPL